jgi:ParB family transcriptional regulator, chromosome partitioning protein
MRRRGGLGRGLEALIPPSSSPDEGRQRAPGGLAESQASDDADAREVDGRPAFPLPIGTPRRASEMAPPFFEVPLDLVDPNPRQPRGAFDEEALEELAASIEAVGVLQPIIVRPSGDRYQIVMGERRVRAAQHAGLSRIPAVVRVTEDHHLLRDALLENVHREDLNPLEEAAAYEQLLSDFSVTHEELAKQIGRSRSAISNALRLLRLPPSVQRRIAAGTLSAGHARAVASLLDPEQQERLADRIVAEGLTVRMAEELVQRSRLQDALQDAQAAQRPRQRPTVQAPGVADLAERLSDRLETRVRVQVGKRKGKVLIEFATLDDLRRICNAIGLDPEAARGMAAARGTADDEPGQPPEPTEPAEPRLAPHAV